MELVLGTHHLLAFGGADSYLITVAEQLLRLGHGVTIHALEQGETADLARGRGIAVPPRESELPERCDAVLVQDVVTAYELAERYPAAPQAFVCHSEVFSIDTPPQLPEVTSVVVAMSERVERHVAALSSAPPVVRLRQPIDLQRFSPEGTPSQPARRAALIGNYLDGARRDLLLGVLAEAGIEVERHGGDRPPTREPEAVMARCDVVVGKGRIVLEAMACGRAAYVYDWTGGDGFVTPANYERLEADAFAGQAGDEPIDRERLRRELAGYDADMGVANRDLAISHHDAGDHARRLVELLRELGAGDAQPRTALRELSLLARREWLAESTAHALRRRNHELHDALEQERRRSQDLAQQLSGVRATRRHRFAEALAAPLDRLRGR